MNCKNRKRGITVALCICLIMCISISMLTACSNKNDLSSIKNCINTISQNDANLSTEIESYLSKLDNKNINIETQEFVAEDNTTKKNYIITLEGRYKDSRNQVYPHALVVTAKYNDIDNNSNITAITMLIENIRKLQEEQFYPNRDVVFALCHENNGGENLYSLMEERYKDLINLNLGEFGQKDNNKIYTYISDNLKSEIVIDNIYYLLSGRNYQLHLVKKDECKDYGNTDYKNTIAIYNYDINDASTEKLKNIDTKSMKELSDFIYDFIRKLSYNDEDITGYLKSCLLEMNVSQEYLSLKDETKFGQYFFYRNSNSSNVNTYINNIYDFSNDSIINELDIPGNIQWAKAIFNSPLIIHKDEELNTIYGDNNLDDNLMSIKEKYKISEIIMYYNENYVSTSCHFIKQTINPSTKAHNYKEEKVDGYILFSSYDEPSKCYEIVKQIDGEFFTLSIKFSNNTQELSKETVDKIFNSLYNIYK